MNPLMRINYIGLNHARTMYIPEISPSKLSVVYFVRVKLTGNIRQGWDRGSDDHVTIASAGPAVVVTSDGAHDP